MVDKNYLNGARAHNANLSDATQLYQNPHLAEERARAVRRIRPSALNLAVKQILVNIVHVINLIFWSTIVEQERKNDTKTFTTPRNKNCATLPLMIRQ
uniref:Uncharacterized protein n=1 Tax=Romanomermis culicivorax TaxID=13658 RepID=A0A915JQX5_ROMCU